MGEKINKIIGFMALVIVSLILAGCDECENGYKIKTEYKTLFFSDTWHKNPKDTILDGAIRVTTSTYKDARSLSIRCFKASNKTQKPRYDLRYLISVPLLKKVGIELEKSGNAEIVVTVDSTAIGAFKAIVVSHDHGISFLAKISHDVIEKLSSASKTIVAMPRQNTEKLDSMTEFGVGKLAGHIKAVKKACEAIAQEKPIKQKE